MLRKILNIHKKVEKESNEEMRRGIFCETTILYNEVKKLASKVTSQHLENWA